MVEPLFPSQADNWVRGELLKRSRYLELIKQRLAADQRVSVTDLAESERIGKRFWAYVPRLQPSATGLDTRVAIKSLTTVLRAQDDLECQLRGNCAAVAPAIKATPVSATPPAIRPAPPVPPGPIAGNYGERGPAGDLHRAVSGRKTFLSGLEARMEAGGRITSEDARTAGIARTMVAKALQAVPAGVPYSRAVVQIAELDQLESKLARAQQAAR